MLAEKGFMIVLKKGNENQNAHKERGKNNFYNSVGLYLWYFM